MSPLLLCEVSQIFAICCLLLRPSLALALHSLGVSLGLHSLCIRGEHTPSYMITPKHSVTQAAIVCTP
ncbi:hypothetical protein GDO78_002210 [Eleutherodactylus coqui]|uniref:Secreted protein n=1 Tax=Eleutherodactylus coqui TaxID=57060 RepID=A0A8J6EXW5_ELECQ|nr:hypothetical protein GDO78_002210 [Eleutherodactylus coqui]